MEAVFEPGASKVGGLVWGDLVEGGELALGFGGGEIEDGVIVFDSAEDFIWGNLVVAVEGDEVVLFVGDALEAIHPVVSGGQ